MNEFQKKAAVTALKKMFNGDYFDICTVDKVIKLSGCIPPDGKDYQALNALHCVHWKDMDKDLRQMVFLKTMQIFEEPGFDVQLLDRFLRHDSHLLN